jgi:type III pantothenate kinase
LKSSAPSHRTLALCLGNSSLLGGVFSDGRLIRRFRLPVAGAAGAGALVRRLAPKARGRIDAAVLCSVVPALTPGIERGVRSICGVTPLRLTAGALHGLRLGYRNPKKLGTDRLAAALGARAEFPGENVLVVDCGTATTITALSRAGVVLGGAILPGIGLWPGMLAARTAQLPLLAPRRPRTALGRSTEEGLRSGIFHGHAGAIRELVGRIRAEAFGRAPAVVVGTGGQAAQFARENLFTALKPDLVLRGLWAYFKLCDDRP